MYFVEVHSYIIEATVFAESTVFTLALVNFFEMHLQTNKYLLHRQKFSKSHNSTDFDFTQPKVRTFYFLEIFKTKDIMARNFRTGSA